MVANTGAQNATEIDLIAKFDTGFDMVVIQPWGNMYRVTRVDDRTKTTWDGAGQYVDDLKTAVVIFKRIITDIMEGY